MLDLPEFTDNDVRLASQLLKLAPDAFFGDDDEARLNVLRSPDSIDVEACPGSGKTTLLVAKLALLAKHWTKSGQGICVLSHTNAAREEIEQRLGTTSVGQTLLRYPHFVGTIHGFVNEFCALPWLRAQGYTPNIIEDEITLSWRWNHLPPHIRTQIERNPQNRLAQDFLKCIDTSFSLRPIQIGRKQTIGPDHPSYKAIRTIIKRSVDRGLFCFDEMFVWASDLLAQRDEVPQLLQERFPILLLDETQDTSEEQSRLLKKIFHSESGSVVRQRFGDSNQAIFNSTARMDESTTDPFPDPSCTLSVANSFRFGQTIAGLSDPFAINQIEGGLQGLGPSKKKNKLDESAQNTIFLFDGDAIADVLPAFGQKICDIFQADPLALQNGDFAAVGAVHRPPMPGAERPPPRDVGDYWEHYQAMLTRKDPVPSSFMGYLRAGLAMRRRSKQSFDQTEMFAAAILRAHLESSGEQLRHRRVRKHRFIRELLTKEVDALSQFQALTNEIIDTDWEMDARDWEQRWLPAIHQVLDGITDADQDQRKLANFLAWDDTAIEEPEPGGQGSNTFIYTAEDGQRVSIRMGSIHSIKGQTHTATLVLDTFYKGTQGRTNLQHLVDWILKDKSGKGKEGINNINRLKLHFVAMTRPTHLLCLAMRKDSLDAEQKARLEHETRWKIEEI